MAVRQGMYDVVVTAGKRLANLYFVYGLFFLALGTTFCVHLGVLVFLAWRRDPRRFPGLIRVLEIIYGLVNPALYLLLISPSLKLDHFAWMKSVGWTVLIGFWAAR